MSVSHASFGGLGTRVAARTFLMFCLSAVVPILISATIADRIVREQLTQQATERLAQTSKSYGLLVFERLRQTEEALNEVARLALAGELTPTEIESYASRQFRVNSVRLNDSVDPAIVARIRSEHSDHVASIALHGVGDRSEVSLSLTRTTNGRALTIAASIADAYLWDADAISMESTSVCIEAPSSRLKRCTEEPAVPGSNTSAPSLHAQWSLYLQPRYGSAPWIVTTRQPVSVALRALHSFERTLPLVTAIAVCVALLLSIVQIRRSHRPLALLTQAAERIGLRRFGRRVRIDSNDEYEHLGRAFNRMSSGLARQFLLLRTLARMDRMILDDPSTHAIIEGVLPSLPRLLRSPVVIVALQSHEDAEIEVAVCTAAAKTSVFRSYRKRRSLESLIGRVSRLDALPAEHFASDDTGGFLGLAIEVEGMVRGAILFSDAPRGKSTRERHARAFVQRFAVALGSYARRQALIRQAYYDELTGLPNRQLFKDRLQRELHRATRSQSRLALICIDLDRFKNVNDSLGHSAGDELLIAVSTRLAAVTREADTLARLGGDEFVVIASDIVEYPAHVLAERLQSALREPLSIQGSSYFVQASIGLTIYPDDGNDAETLLRNADIAMYRSKTGGRDGITYFEEHMNRDAQQRLLIEQRLRIALRDSVLTLAFQPKVRLADGLLCGVEALARWTDSELGVVSPGVFIAVAEECGLIDELGSWALREACRTFQTLLHSGTNLGHVSVNVSMRQLRSTGFVDVVRSTLEQAGMAAAALELEITESALADNPEKAARVLTQMRLLGVRISIDDFGTGYSSMSSLAVLPTDTLKIDSSFVRDCAHDTKARSVAAAIVSLAHTLGKQTVAEGVETLEQLGTLRQLGCDCVQGYLLGRPVPMAALKHLPAEESRWSEAIAKADDRASRLAG